METAKVDLRKLQLLNDRISQVIEALNQVRFSVHGLQHTAWSGGLPQAGWPTPGMTPWAGQQWSAGPQWPAQWAGYPGTPPVGTLGLGGLSHSELGNESWGAQSWGAPRMAPELNGRWSQPFSATFPWQQTLPYAQTFPWAYVPVSPF